MQVSQYVGMLQKHGKSRVRKAKYICELTLTGKKLKFYKWLDNKKPNPAECAGKNCIDKGVKCSIS